MGRRYRVMYFFSRLFIDIENFCTRIYPLFYQTQASPLKDPPHKILKLRWKMGRKIVEYEFQRVVRDGDYLENLSQIFQWLVKNFLKGLYYSILKGCCKFYSVYPPVQKKNFLIENTETPQFQIPRRGDYYQLFINVLLLLAFTSFLVETTNLWAMHETYEEECAKDPSLPKKRTRTSNSRLADGRDILDDTALKKLCPPTPVMVAQALPVSSSASQKRTLFDLFKEILVSEPCPLQEMRQITAPQEDQEGSRKWVKFFSDPTDKEPHEWHQKMPEVITALRQQNDRGKYFPGETNFAVARLIFILQEGNPQIFDIPYFFASGWPANRNKSSALKFAKALAEEKLGEKLKVYKNYGLRFITKSYQGEEEVELRRSSFDPFRDEIKEIMDKELEREDSIPGKDRLQTHSKLMSSPDNEILGKLYFHSEQSIWMTVQNEIAKFKEALKRRSMGDIRSYCSTFPDPLRHVFLDICSFYDMCWCCGDTLASCCHTLTLGTQVYVRASGCSAYYDRPFEVRPPYALRDHRKEFLGYEEGKSFQIPVQEGEDTLYKPYIAHSVASDFP
ncbi:MAG: hypothetical protein K2P93_09210 [Alphaproteobacteria bacterium]|nr:hypothetical protein [Alphaproteobacteria bacterium]